MLRTKLNNRGRLLDFAEEIGPEWDGFFISADREFCNPQWKRGFTPGDLKAQFWDLQGLRIAKHDVAQLKRELDRLQNKLDAAEIAAQFYRSQLVLESRAGLMLAKITDLAT